MYSPRQYIFVFSGRPGGKKILSQELLERPAETGTLAVGATWKGERLKQIREAAGYRRQKDLADAAGTSQANISRWEAESAIPGADDLYELGDVLGVSCEEFRKEVGSPIRWARKRKKDKGGPDAGPVE